MKSNYFIFLLFIVFNFGFGANATNLIDVTATISGSTTVCQNAPNPLITFTGSGGTAPYTFTYKINGGDDLTILTSGTNSSITISASTISVGTFNYTLVSVKDFADVTQAQTGLVTIIINTPPTVDFTFSNNICSGIAFQFTSTVSGMGSAVYSWNFGDGTPLSTSQYPSHVFTSLGCGTQTFNVVLTVTKNGCTVIKSHIVTVKQKPDISFTDSESPFNPFNNCNNASSNPAYTITVANNSISTCISSFSINWGDNVVENNITFPKTHTYSSNGVYSMTITAVGANGCSNTKTYIVKNVSNPLGGLNSPGSTQNLCTPTANLQFSITSWGSNSLDTTYNIDYGDGETLVLTQTQLNASPFYNSANPALSTNYPIPHIYTTSSCPLPSFELKLDVTNACSTTPFTLGNISTLTKPTANFNAPSNSCVGTSVLFTNTTIVGYNLSCDKTAIYKWDFGDG